MESPTNREWLATTVEPALEPELPICDPHHHLWEFRYQRVAHRYLLDELLLDTGAGHNVVSTVFIECGAMYREDGPEHLQVIGETEFVNGIAAMSASGLYGPCRVAAGIVGNADLNLGAAAGEVLDAHLLAGGGRFRGIRHQGTWDANEAIGNGRNVLGPKPYLSEVFQAGFAELAPRTLSFEAWCYHHQIPDVTALARAFPDTSARDRALRRPTRGIVRGVAARYSRACVLSERGGETRWHQHGAERVWLARAAERTRQRSTGGCNPCLL